MNQQEANYYLIDAAILGKVEQAQDAISKGADVDVKSSDGVTPLFYAVERKYPEIVRLLIEKGANINADDGMGNTPLHSAAEKGFRDIAKILIDAGANTTLKNWQKRTPYDIAASGPVPDITTLFAAWRQVKPISRVQQEVNYYLIDAAILGNLEQAQDAISKGADVDVKSSDGVTPLFYAVERKYPEIVRFLIEKGANVNADDGMGNTPLHSAAEKGFSDIAEILIDAGADTTLKNWQKRTPAEECAATGQDHGMAGMIEAMGRRATHVGRVQQGRRDKISQVGD